MKASRILRRLLLLALVFGLVWCLVVVYWRATDATPSSTDLALYLGALPLGLVGGFWLLRTGIDRAKRGPATATASGDAPASPAETGNTPVDIELALLASAVQTVAGGSGADIAQALMEPQRPALHGQLKDGAGLPVMAAQVEELDTESLADALAAINRDQDPSPLFGEERLRALALLDPVADELLLAALEAMPPAATPAPLHGQAPAAPASLRVQLLLPAAWPQPARQLAADWLHGKAHALGLDPAVLTVESLPLASAADAWRVLAAIGQPGPHAADAYLLLAADSHIGTASIERLEAQGRLFGARRQEGLVPGEAAAGVLLAGPGTRLQPALPTPRLHRVAQQRREGGIQSKATTRQLGALMQQSLTVSARPPENIAAVVSDADQRPSRAADMAGAVSAVFPELDPLQQCLSLGVACGHTGIATPLAVLAVAAARAVADNSEVMAIGLGDDEALAALLVSPAPEPPSPAADSAAANA